MKKLNIGDKVRILDVDSIFLGDQYWRNGDIAEVVGYHSGDPCLKRTIDSVDGDLQIHSGELRYVELVDDTSARLTEAEAKIAALEAEVETIKCQIYSLEKNKADTPALSAITQRTFQPKQTPNQRRADVIKRAQAIVAEKYKPHWNESGDRVIGNGLYLITPEFIVNTEKRTVVVLIRFLAAQSS